MNTKLPIKLIVNDKSICLLVDYKLALSFKKGELMEQELINRLMTEAA